SARSGALICSTIRMTCSMAPPWSGPLRAPIAEVIAECRSDMVAAVTRAAKVEALNSWSACRMSATSNVFTSSGVGLPPRSMARKFAARESFGFGATRGFPERMRSHAATSVGICAVSRTALRAVASRELSAESGSKAERADTPVRSTSIGVVFFGSARSRAISPAGSFRVAVAASALTCAASARRRGGDLARLSADDLFEFDQDHYGGLAAVDALARRTAITAASRVLDVCAGLAGPARFLTSRRGCGVVALERNAGRAAGAARLTRLVGLEGRVRVVRGDASALPFREGSFDACVSQEAFQHIADKLAVLAGCRRVLAPG